MRGQLLFAIRESSDVPSELWRQFVERCHERGTTPAQVFHALIRRYVEGDATPRRRATDDPLGTRRANA